MTSSRRSIPMTTGNCGWWASLGRVPTVLVFIAVSALSYACGSDGSRARVGEVKVVDPTPTSAPQAFPEQSPPTTEAVPKATPDAPCSPGAGAPGATSTERLEPTPTPTATATERLCTETPVAPPDPPDVQATPRIEFPGCQDEANEAHYCLTLAGGAVTMIGLDSGRTCPIVTTDAPAGGFPLADASIAWLGGHLYVCGEGGLIRISLRDGSWDVGGRPCDAVASYDGGLLINSWLADFVSPDPGSWGSPPLRWYSDYDAVLNDEPERTFSLGSFSESITVQGEKLYSAWHAGISVDVGDLSTDQALGVLTLEDYDGWMLGMAVTEDGYLVLSGDPWGSALYVFDAYDGHRIKKIDAFASGLVCVASGTVTPRETPTATPTATPNTAEEPTATPCTEYLGCPDPCTGLESDPKPFQLYELPPSIPIEMNCLDGGYGSSNYAVSDDLLVPDAAEEVHVIGVYEGRGNPGFRHESQGFVEVTVHARPKPIVLALTSYEAMLWRVALDPDARLSRVILQGYGTQEVEGVPIGVPVIHRRPEDACGYAYGWEVSQNSGGGGYIEMMASLRRYTSLIETSFQGCYAGDRFEVPYWSGDPPTGASTPVPGNEDLPRAEVVFADCADVTAESAYCLAKTSGALSVLGLESGRLCRVVSTSLPPILPLDSSLSWRGEIAYTCGSVGGLTRISLLDGSQQAMQVGCSSVADYDGGFLISDLFMGIRFYPSLALLRDDVWTMSYSLPSPFARVAAGGDKLYTAPFYATDRVGVQDAVTGEVLPELVLEDFNGAIAAMAVTTLDELVIVSSGLFEGDFGSDELILFDARTGAQLSRRPVAEAINGLACVVPGNGE